MRSLSLERRLSGVKMPKIESIMLGFLLGRVHEIKARNDDSHGNPQATLIIRTKNPFKDGHKFDHWVTVWGKNQMKELDYVKEGNLVLVFFKGYPFNYEWDGKQKDSMQYQSIFIFSIGGIMHKKKKEPEAVNEYKDDENPVEVAQTAVNEDEVPF